MTDDADHRRRAAQAILENQLINELWDEIEKAAINATINAKHDDHEGRQAHAAEARAIRKVRQRLESIASDGQIGAARRAPA
jgi:cell fate (sporulation/competence/biofilm development) regulator YmcA (YheA/YmcA/DUF963 family)